MHARFASRWLAIASVAALVACRGDAAAPQRPVAPVAPVASSTPTTSIAPQPVAPPPAADTAPPAAAAAAPPTTAALEPPVVEPPALPPCAKDPQRDATQKPDHVVQLAGLSDAMTVVDLGSGSGYFLCWLSRAVGPHGRVIATEVDKALVRDLHKRVEREKLPNVEVILAPANDIGIAAGSADRILLVNVWHHLPDRKHYAARVARALSPGGKVVVIDFKPRGDHGIAPERVLAELTAGGIDGALVTEDLPDQYVIIGTLHAGAARASLP
jgi:predicted methyltransferase